MSLVQLKKLTSPGLVICAKQNAELLNKYFNKEFPVMKAGQVETHHGQKVVLFDNQLSRNLGVFRTDQLEKQLGNIGDNNEVLVVVPNSSWCVPTAISVARHFPLFTRKTTKTKQDTIVLDIAMDNNGKFEMASSSSQCDSLNRYIESTQLAAEIVDMPPNELYTSSYVDKVKETFKGLPVEMEHIFGEDLRKKGFGGLWNVGKAAVFPPALLVVSYYGAPKEKESIALVGKGIVYDSGGLSIKGTSNMVYHY